MADETDLRVFSELFPIAEERLWLYGNWVYASAFDSPGDGTNRNLFTLVYPLRVGEPELASEKRDYGTMRLVNASLPWVQIESFLARVANQGRVCLPQLPEIPMVVGMHPTTSPNRVSSRQ